MNPRDWAAARTKGEQAFEFRGVFYASSLRSRHLIVNAIADVVCPSGGVVICTKAPPDGQDEDGAA